MKLRWTAPSPEGESRIPQGKRSARLGTKPKSDHRPGGPAKCGPGPTTANCQNTNCLTRGAPQPLSRVIINQPPPVLALNHRVTADIPNEYSPLLRQAISSPVRKFSFEICRSIGRNAHTGSMPSQSTNLPCANRFSLSGICRLSSPASIHRMNCALLLQSNENKVITSKKPILIYRNKGLTGAQ
jgi:hypothetical protein